VQRMREMGPCSEGGEVVVAVAVVSVLVDVIGEEGEGEEASAAMNVSSARRLVCRAIRAALEAV